MDLELDLKTSFGVLCEIFPQIDKRIIKAVTLEHGDDVNSAIEFILSEVVPKQNAHQVTEGLDLNSGDVNSLPSSTGLLADSKALSTDDTLELFDEVILAGKKPIQECFNRESIPESRSPHLSNSGQSRGQLVNTDSTFHLDGTQSSICGQLGFREEDDEISSICGQLGFREEEDDLESYLGQLSCRGIANTSSFDGENQSMKDMIVGDIDYSPVDKGSVKSLDMEAILCLDADDFSEKQNMNQLSVSQPIRDTIDFLSVFSKENSLHKELDIKDSYSSVESGSLSCSRVSSSSQIVDTDGLEGLVSKAKKNKEALMEGMELIRSLWTKTTQEEAAARCVKEEAAKGGMDILSEVMEIRKTIANTKEANDMHAGEVYGERAILATEARELRSRLAQLATEKDATLSMVNEMCKMLQDKYDAARKEKEAALEEKMMKEDAARNILSIEKTIMAEVAQDSRDLELEAETNSKLREFLIDRGHTVDALQGELSVLYQDVKLLKEKIDGGSGMVASGLFSIKLASSSRHEDEEYYRACESSLPSSPRLTQLGVSTNCDVLELGESIKCEVSISGKHQTDAKDAFVSSPPKSFNLTDYLEDSRSGTIYGNSESHNSVVYNSLGVSMDSTSLAGSCDRLTDLASDTVAFSTNSYMDHLTDGVQGSMAGTHAEYHHESPPSLNLSGEGRNQHIFGQSSDDDEWQILDEVHEGFNKPRNRIYSPSKSKLKLVI